MKLRLHYWNYSTPSESARIAPTLAATARIAEQAGLSSFTVMDHYFQMEAMASVDEPILEGYTTLSYLAGRTEWMTPSWPSCAAVRVSGADASGAVVAERIYLEITAPAPPA